MGCSTVERAREAQRAVAAKGTNAPSAVSGKLDLRGYSLEKLVSFALTNRPSVVSARLAVEEARLALRALAADAPILSDTPWTAPKLSLNGSYSESSSGASINHLSDGLKTSGDPAAAVSLELLVYDFGRYDAAAKAQAEQVVAAEMSLVEAGYTVFGEVASAYFSDQEKRALLMVSIENERQYAAHLARAEERLKAGEAYRLDVLKARLDLANARQETVAASNELALAGAQMMYALGIDAARGTCDDVFGREPIADAGVRRGFERSHFGIDAAYALARTNAPSMQISRARVRAASHTVDKSIADLYPTLSASLSISWTDPLWFWNWGVSAAQSLFQGFRKVTAVDQAVVALNSAAADVDAAEQDLSVKLEKALAVRDNSREAIASARASVRHAKENLDVVQEQLTVGTVSRIELSDAIAGYSTARGTSISAFYDGQRAEAALFVLLGRYPVYREEIVKEDESK